MYHLALLLLSTILAVPVSSQDNNSTTTYRYTCETTLKRTLLNQDVYDRSVVPILGGELLLDVIIQMEVNQMTISNHGIDGGDVDISGALHLSWKDERLVFDDDDECVGLSSLHVPFEQIWVPDLAEGVFEAVDWPSVTLYNNGTVSWSQHGTMRLHCQVRGTGLLENPSKICAVDVQEGRNPGGVHYVSGGIHVDNGVSIPEYVIHHSNSSVVENGKVHLELHFSPLDQDCSLCGSDAVLHEDALIKYYPRSWLRQFPHTEGWNCSELDVMLQTTSNVSDYTCLMGRAYFEEACCDDTRPSYDCERSIHQALVEENTVTPPDPHPKENDDVFVSQDMVDVQVQLDLVHFLGIDVKSNTLKVLVSLELDWFDQNLAWHPFIGGCHRVSYRASLDAEQTEIWVPEVELINLVEGVKGLPEGHASVRYDGFVKWRRTGILVATCELGGIEKFPFDQTGCSMDFGGVRDPLYHRVNLLAPDNVQFGANLVDESWNYQEYKVVNSKTEVFTKTDKLSGFENKIIHFQFYFERAQSFYVNMFVVLYIIFTYLSFGMLFVNYKIGERLGYGSSILFVLVAQDITLADSTPVTQEYLWIYKLSFGSKMFVVYAIFHSIIMLWLYSHAEEDERVTEAGSREENRPFLEEGSDAEATKAMEAVEDGVADGEGGPPSSEMPVPTTTSSSSKTATGGHRGKFALMISRACKKVYSCVCCLDIKESKGEKKLAYLHAIDFRMALFCIALYSLFLTIMFTAGLA